MVENIDLSGIRVKDRSRFEQILSQSKEARAVFKTAQQILRDRLQIDLDLSCAQFVSQEEVIRQDRIQSAQSNKLAKPIIENNLPLPVVSQLKIANGAIVDTPKGPQIFLSMDEFGRHFIRRPQDLKSRESLSAVSIHMFNNLTRLAIEYCSPKFGISTDKKVIKGMSGVMVMIVNQVAENIREYKVNDFISYVGALGNDRSKLSIDIKGAKVRLLHDQEPLVIFGEDQDNALKLLISDSLEEEFAAKMEGTYPWFIQPHRFHAGIISDEFKSLNYNQAAQEARNKFPELMIPEDLNELIIMYMEGNFAIFSLKTYALDFGVTRVEKLTNKASETGEEAALEAEAPPADVLLPKKEKKKKSKAAPVPIQNFKKKQKARNTPDPFTSAQNELTESKEETSPDPSEVDGERALLNQKFARDISNLVFPILADIQRKKPASAGATISFIKAKR